MAALHGGTHRLGSRSPPTCGPASGWCAGAPGRPSWAATSEVAERIAEYHDLGITEFILSGHPHLEEAYRVGEGVVPALRRAGLLAGPRTRTPSIVREVADT